MGISGSGFNFASIVNLRINEREFCRKYTEKRDSSCRQYTEKCDFYVESIPKSVTFM